MPGPRKHLVSLEATPYYHCTTRCVRRAFLCGKDHKANQCFEHRRQWIEERILSLSTIFAIDVCAYAVMSNHYHVVLRINQHQSSEWTDHEVCRRWHQLYKGTLLTQRFLRKESLSKAERDVISLTIEQWRQRLTDISWFMRNINEPIARMANEEDNCKGRFWEARFSSQALLDEKALVACMAYVDLNPVRANMAKTPEQSDHTSIKKRIANLQEPTNATLQPNTLLPFVGSPREPKPEGLPFHLKDYLELVDWTGRVIRDDKRGAIPNPLPGILDRLCIGPNDWMILATRFENRFKSLIGSVEKLKQAAHYFNYRRTPGLSMCKALF